MNKSTVSDDNINMYCDKRKLIFTEINNVYRCMRILNITEELISKTKDLICKTMILWRELKLPVTPCTHLFEDHIVH